MGRSGDSSRVRHARLPWSAFGANGAENLGHEEASGAGEAGVVVGEARFAVVGLESVGDLGHLAAAFVLPRVAQQRRLAHLQHLAQDDAAPAGLGFRDELEPGADRGGEALRPGAGAGGRPPRDQLRIGDRTPDLLWRVRVVADDVDGTHGGLPVVAGVKHCIKLTDNVNLQ